MIRRLRIRLIISVLLSTTLLAVIRPVQAENIDTVNDGSQYAYGENIGWISLEPGGDGGPGVEVADAALSGYMWGETAGWISFQDTAPVAFKVTTAWRATAPARPWQATMIIWPPPGP